MICRWIKGVCYAASRILASTRFPLTPCAEKSSSDLRREKAKHAKVSVFVCLLLMTSIALRAQTNPSDPIGDSFFPSELVMQHQQALGLSEEQKSFLKEEMRKGQLRFTELQWQLQDELEKMVAQVKTMAVERSLRVKRGIWGDYPSLAAERLVLEGNLDAPTDYRKVFATILARHCDVDPQPIVGVSELLGFM